MKIDWKRDLRRLLLVVVASAIIAVNLKMFVRPAEMYPGGMNGLSMLMQTIFSTYLGLQVPFTVFNVIFNSIPVYIGLRFLGRKFTILSIITIILSYFTIVFGELVPKRIAMQKPLQMAKLACGVVSGLAVIMRPVVRFLSLSTNLVLRALRLKTSAEEESVTEEEIRMMVDIGEETGTIENMEKEFIENIFEFTILTDS